MKFLDRIRSFDLIWQLLLPAILTAVLSVAAVQAWSLHVSQSALEERMELNLDTNMSLLKAYLSRLGTGWSSDGKTLRLGNQDITAHSEIIDETAVVSKGVATVFYGDQRVMTNIKKPDGTRAIGTKLTDEKIRDAVLGKGQTFHGSAMILNNRYITIYEPIRNEQNSIIGILFVGLPSAELDAVETSILVQGIITGLIVTILLAFANVQLMKRSLKPLDKLGATMEQLASGKLDVIVEGLDRKDQIGRMSASLQIFKEAAYKKAQLEVETNQSRAALEVARSDREREKLEDDRRKVLELKGMVDQVENETRVAVSAVVQMMDDMTRITGSMCATAEGLTQDSSLVAQRAQDGQSAMTSAKSATDSLAISINKVSSEVDRTKAITASAVKASEETSRTIESLSKVVGEITGASELISSISRQTALLAINAGVEAARSGQDGRGFAVIANEVRALSEQTSGATKTIVTLAHQISESMQMATSSVGDISGSIREIDLAANEIFSAINDQVRTTKNIVGSVSETADMTTEVSKRIQQVAEQAKDSGRQASEVDEVCATVASQVRALQENLVRIVRTCSSEIERRAEIRHPMGNRVDVRCGASRASGHAENVSNHGAKISGHFPFHGPIVVNIQGFSQDIRAHIISQTAEFINVEFELNAGEEARLADWINKHLNRACVQMAA